QPDHSRVDALQNGLENRRRAKKIPKRERTCHQQKRRKKDRYKGQESSTPAIGWCVHHSTQVSRKCKKRSRHRLSRSIAGNELLVRDPPRANNLRLQQR